MKTALITGVTGQDGSYLAELLLENNQAIEMKSLITKELDILKDNLTSITIDEVLKVMGFDKDHYIV